MAKKKVAITISGAPHGTNKVQEGLRMAVGLCAGEDEHDVSMIFCGDGVYSVLSDIIWDEVCENCWKMMRKLKLKLYVDSESMEERGIQEADMDEPMEIINRKDINRMINFADFHMNF